MPLFEFICKKCSTKFETLVFNDESIVCPVCKSGEIVKQFSSFISKTSSLFSCPSADCCVPASDCEHKCSGGGCCCH
ncbi:MAG: zinc ribbon domain-containing protein [Endomicrobium sp.]|jgi:putative FmdB family regulatory protein|nr:zinc ribbon domain-containing protein [Endomicrobium sp.]